MGLQNVLRLSSFVSTAKQNDYCAPSLNEINPKSRAVINPKFRHAVSNRPHLSRVSQRQSSDANIDPSLCRPVSQTVEPLPVCLSLADFYHWHIVSHRIQSVNALCSNMHPDSCAAEGVSLTLRITRRLAPLPMMKAGVSAVGCMPLFGGALR